jgi:hypothetical protein
MTLPALAVSDVRKIAGEPRVADLRLGEVLGYAKPINVRRVVRKHHKELQRHGRLNFNCGNSISGKGRVMESREYDLNEAQALVVCMHAQTPQAVEVRAQIIEVFLAYRRGELTRKLPVSTPTNDLDSRWAKMERRLRQLEKLVAAQPIIDSPAYARAVAYAPTVLFLQSADGRRRRQRRPRWWGDIAVRGAVIEYHRQMTIDEALLNMQHRFGDRAPSRSSLGRFWRQLDENRAVN